MIFGAFAFEELLHLAALVVDVGDGRSEGRIAQALKLDGLLVVLAVEEMLVHILRGEFGKVLIECRVGLCADGSGHLRHCRERAEIDAGAHSIGAPELDVVGVVMGLEERAVMVGIPGADAVIETALNEWIDLLEPGEVAGDLPIAEDLHDAAELAVGGGVPIVIDGAIGDRAAEVHMTALVHGANKFHVAKRAFEMGVEMRHGLSVVPHVSAGTVAAAGVRRAAFPSPYVSVFLAQYGG